MSYILEVCKSRRKKKTPSIFVKHFKRSFEALNISNRKPKLITTDCSTTEFVEIPKIIYLAPKNQAIYSEPTSKHNEDPEIETMNQNSSFQLCLSRITLDENYSQGRTPEKYLKARNPNWKTVNTVALVKRRSPSNLTIRDITPTKSLTELKLLDMCESEKSIEKKTFGKKYIKRKLAKLFRSSGKLNETNVNNNGHSCVLNIESDEQENNISPQNEALRNLSFTTAIMSDGKKSAERCHVDYKTEHLVKPISTSTLRFWKKPTEEKFKACQRRTQDNFYNLNKASSRLKSITNNINNSSELGWYDEEMRVESSNNFEKLFGMHPIESVKLVGKDFLNSGTYDQENYYENIDIEMRNSQSAGNINALSRTDSIIKSINDDEYWKSCQSDVDESVDQQSFPHKKEPKSNGNVLSTSSVNEAVKVKNKRNTIKNAKHNGPKPPTRSDSLFRSLELICNKLQSSISKSPSDSFRDLKNQNNYQQWLKSLPYRQSDQPSSSIKLRTDVSRRVCLSEVLNSEIADGKINEEQQYSCPTLKFENCSEDNISKKMSHSKTSFLYRSNSLNGFKDSSVWSKRQSFDLEASYQLFQNVENMTLNL